MEADETGLRDFCYLQQLPEYRLSKFERLTLTGGPALERAVQRLARQFEELTPRSPIPEVHVSEIHAAIEFYGSGDWGSEPHTFFAYPVGEPLVSETKVHGLRDGEIVDLQFRSRYLVQNPALEGGFAPYTENQTVSTRLWRHTDLNRTTIVAIHGWTMGDQRLNSLAFLPGLFYRLGFNVALIELPFHGRRVPAGQLQPQESLFPGADLVLTNEAMGQAISDLRELKLYLESRGAESIGVIGMSLGSYIAALWCSLDRLSFCVPMVPMVSLAEVAWEILKRDAQFERLRSEGLTLDLLREVNRIHCPLNYSCKLHPEQTLIVAGIGDKLVPARQPKMLWEHWKWPTLHWISGGHVTQLRKSRAYEEIIKFLGRLGFP